MAENFERAANARKKKLPSMDCLIRQGNDILEKRKKRRKPIHYEYSTDPKTGQRSCKNTYNPKYYNRDDTASSSRSKNLEEHSDNIFQEQEPPEVSLLDRESDMDVTTKRCRGYGSNINMYITTAKNAVKFLSALLTF
ncbi:uncharacterized protein LOC114536729 [Dendronephthya gigantea]|uniref:uncharacterized protein LOC114536729 n=1 Tax=Dendronephthya gigantea TaxID=151771 RepID=UPI00106A791E|nr:uncharacterized protein LOC114536729 [Dendronephthya gigantea]